jgi:polyphosphate kinase
VRGICCLRPGVPGLSENIRVFSILGRFLEHSRIYSFRTAQRQTTYIGSADLMPRNLDARIEVITPVEDPFLVAEIDATLDVMLADTAGCWTLDADGVWHRRRPEPDVAPFSSQAALMERAVAQADGEAVADRREAAAERRLVRRPQPGKPGARAAGAD